MKICIECTPEEFRKLFIEPKQKIIAKNSEIIDSIRDAVYRANLSVLKSSCDTSVDKKQ